MNLDNAQRHIRAVVEESLDESAAIAVCADQAFVDRHVGALLHQVSLADPDSTNDEAAHEAAVEYAATLRAELRHTQPSHFRGDD